MDKSDKSFYWMVAAIVIGGLALILILLSVFNLFANLFHRQMDAHPVTACLLSVLLIIGMYWRVSGSTATVDRAAEFKTKGRYDSSRKQALDGQVGLSDDKVQCGSCNGSGREEERDRYRSGLYLLSFPRVRHRVCSRCKGTGRSSY